MPSAEHESPVALAKLDPGLVAWLLTNVFQVKVPDYHHAMEVRLLVPHVRRAASTLVFCDSDDRPLLAVLFESQRRWDHINRRSLNLYVAQLEAELDVDVALLIFVPDARTASRYRNRSEYDGLSLSLRPLVFTPTDVPLVLDVEQARANPGLAALSAICHGHDAQVEATFLALMGALRALDPSMAVQYRDAVLAGLPTAARVRWEEYSSTTVGHEYRSELLRKLAARQDDFGEARGEARAVLTVLEGRGIPVTAEHREQILACTDPARLETWLLCASTATTIGDVLHD
nr:hypothetical protein [Micromonospora sp. DSM 115978]